MPIIDTKNPNGLEFIKECYEKEEKLRSNWAVKYASFLRKAAYSKENVKDYTCESVSKYLIQEGLATNTRDYISGGRYRRRCTDPDPITVVRIKEKSKEELHLGDLTDSEFKPPTVMRSIESQSKKLIYNTERGGRLDYLKQRAKEYPDHRYYDCPNTNWEYGWALEKKKMKQAAHGHCAIIARLIKDNRVGPIRDPDYYNEPTFGRYTVVEPT